MLVILGLMPLIMGLKAAESKPDASWIVLWYVVLLTLSVALGWLVHEVYSEPLNKALRLRSPSVSANRAMKAPPV
jgi:peptidoglycan/LPS O-acetylase OafA/YrhL